MKRVIVLAAAAVVLAGAAFELGSPTWARHEAANAAKAAAAAGARSLVSTRNTHTAETAAAKAASAGGATLESFTQQPNGTVKVTVSEEAKSYLLRRFSVTRDWYEIKETATSAGG
jgi:Flp pilus assembly protein TadG